MGPAGRPTPAELEMEELSRLTVEELERLAKKSVDGMFNELRAAGAAVRHTFGPVELARRHPRIAGAVGVFVGLLVLRLVRGSRREAASSSSAKPETITRAFGRSFLSSTAKLAGRGLAGALLWGLARRGRGTGQGTRGQKTRS